MIRVWLVFFVFVVEPVKDVFKNSLYYSIAKIMIFPFILQGIQQKPRPNEQTYFRLQQMLF